MESIHIEFGDPLDEIICHHSRGEQTLFIEEIEKLQQQFNFVKITYKALLDENVIVKSDLYTIYINDSPIDYGRIDDEESALLSKRGILRILKKDINKFGAEKAAEFYGKYFKKGENLITEIIEVNQDNGAIKLKPDIEGEIENNYKNIVMSILSKIKKTIINSFDDNGNLKINLDAVVPLIVKNKTYYFNPVTAELLKESFSEMHKFLNEGI
jgi:hypothetical protein